jgi:amino acid permease
MRWLILTPLVVVAAYTVAKAIPFFKDLVALIGSLTSVPLTPLLPALFWRKHRTVPLWKPTWDSLYSYMLVLFAAIFMVAATVGSVYSIQQDWSTQGAPFRVTDPSK